MRPRFIGTSWRWNPNGRFAICIARGLTRHSRSRCAEDFHPKRPTRSEAFSRMSEVQKKVRVTTFRRKRERGEKIAILTAYDATMARIFDQAGIDALLVGDSLGMAVMGH